MSTHAAVQWWLDQATDYATLAVEEQDHNWKTLWTRRCLRNLDHASNMLE